MSSTTEARKLRGWLNIDASPAIICQPGCIGEFFAVVGTHFDEYTSLNVSQTRLKYGLQFRDLTASRRSSPAKSSSQSKGKGLQERSRCSNGQLKPLLHWVILTS
jgi:hypothetical protein